MNKIKTDFTVWADEYHHRIIIFNLVVVFLFLLHSVGYFHPFLPITINLIVLLVFLLSIFLLGAKSRAFFVVSLFFWIITGFFKVVRVDVWAERSAIYVFQSLLFGVVLLLWENSGISTKTK